MSTSGYSGGGLNPVTASRLSFTSPAQLHVASGAFAQPHWIQNNETVGTDIGIDPGNDTQIVIHTNGLYAVTFAYDAAVDGADTVRDVDIEISGGVVAVGDVFVTGTAFTEWAFSVPCPVYFAAAGTVITFAVKMALAAAGLWSLNGADVRIQRVA